MPAALKLNSGQRFGRFVSIERINRRGRGQFWRFKCDCGDETVKRASQVVGGFIKSCGCLRGSKSRHGHSSRRQNPSRYTKEYICWLAIKARCGNPKQPNWRWYGGRGIRVCKRWLGSFEAFLEDMGPKPPRHSIERIDNDGDYEPRNCRWATHAEQMKNKKHGNRWTNREQIT